MEFHRRAALYLRSGGALGKIDDELTADWIDLIRERIYVAANFAGLKPRDYAATLVALLANNEHCTVVHIGDGAAVVRKHQTQEWSVPSWPFHGEYASTTRFVTDDPVARFNLVHLESAIDRFAIFSDGMENLVLDHREKSAPAALFERLLQPLVIWEGVGRNRTLSRHLRDYLGSEKVCNATDDVCESQRCLHYVFGPAPEVSEGPREGRGRHNLPCRG